MWRPKQHFQIKLLTGNFIVVGNVCFFSEIKCLPDIMKSCLNISSNSLSLLLFQTLAMIEEFATSPCCNITGQLSHHLQSQQLKHTHFGFSVTLILYLKTQQRKPACISIHNLINNTCYFLSFA